MFPSICLRTRGHSEDGRPFLFFLIRWPHVPADGNTCKWRPFSKVHKPNTFSPSGHQRWRTARWSWSTSSSWSLSLSSAFCRMVSLIMVDEGLMNDVCFIMSYNCFFIMALLSCLWFKRSLPWSWRERGKAATRLLLTECRVQCKCLLHTEPYTLYIPYIYHTLCHAISPTCSHCNQQSIRPRLSCWFYWSVIWQRKRCLMEE